VRLYRFLSNYREFLILNLGGCLFGKKSWGDQKKPRFSRKPLIEFSKRHASPYWDLAWSDMGGKICGSTNLPAIRESFAYKGILANGFCFRYHGMLLILDHYSVAIESFAGLLEKVTITR